MRSALSDPGLAQSGTFCMGEMESPSNRSNSCRRRAGLAGATALYFAERHVNPDFATWSEPLWNVCGLFFSGLDQPPKTPVGRLITMAFSSWLPEPTMSTRIIAGRSRRKTTTLRERSWWY